MDGIFAPIFFQFLFSFLGRRQEVEGEPGSTVQTVAGLIPKGPGW